MFALGSRQLLSEFDMGKYLEQEELLGDFYGIFNKWFGGYSHPYTVERVNRILDFMYSDNAIEISKKIKSNFKTRFIPNIVPADNHERKAVFCSVCGMEIESNTDICAFCGNEV